MQPDSVWSFHRLGFDGYAPLRHVVARALHRGVWWYRQSDDNLGASIVVGEVTLVRSGGFAGITTTVIVQADGTILIINNSDALPEVSLPQPELDWLHAIVSNPEFADLRKTFVSPYGVCCDLYTYTVTAEVGDKFIESTTSDTVETPRNLQQVINILTGLIP